MNSLGKVDSLGKTNGLGMMNGLGKTNSLGIMNSPCVLFVDLTHPKLYSYYIMHIIISCLREHFQSGYGKKT